MQTHEIHGISEAKKAPFKVALGTEAFLASESTFISPGFIFPAPATAASNILTLTLHRQRETQLPTRADGFAAARLRRYVPMDDDADKPKMFRTLRGFLNGQEPDAANYFCFSATLRIHGEGIPFEEIGQRLAVEPTHLHRKGEQPRPRSPAWRDDAWHYKPTLPESEPLEHHIEALWEIVRPHVEYIKALKQRFKVDVFCGYRSNCDSAGFEVSHKCLELFTALEVPFGVSVIIA